MVLSRLRQTLDHFIAHQYLAPRPWRTYGYGTNDPHLVSDSSTSMSNFGNGHHSIWYHDDPQLWPRSSDPASRDGAIRWLRHR